MALLDLAAPVVTVAGSTALVYVILRNFPRVAHAVLVLLAGVIAIATRNKERRESCQKVLDALAHQHGDPPGPDLPRRRKTVSPRRRRP